MTLSNKAQRNTDVGGPELESVYWETDVKIFIEELKGRIRNDNYVSGFKNNIIENLFPIIDELAGEELINK